jgi:N-acetylated-alpha-linked acidic dipeptidase
MTAVGRRWRVTAVCGGMMAVLTVAGASQEPGVRGFTRDQAASERQREEAFRAIPSADNLRDYMRTISAEPHNAGSPGSLRVATYVLQQLKGWGLDAQIEQFQALMPTPIERVVELVEPERYTAVLKEPAIPEDPDSGDANQLPTFNAYSADGDVTAEVVYVNYGVPADYEELAKQGIEVKGRIVIARYGGSWRGIKPKVAAEHGAVGCIIYSDPRDDGYFQGDAYPKGPYRPEQGVQRGSVMDMPLYPGDPLTPGWGSEKGGKQLPRSEAKTLVTIPVLPISYGDALPILRNLAGPVAPEGWRGALPITYHLGAGPAKVHLKLSFDWQVRPLYDVVARIEGAEFPDEWIVYGNHHDAWVNGASDPTSGNVALMETARAFSELLKQGWRPKRTIVLASWDGEEWGLLGSTEWAEKHAPELRDKAVVYINSDSNSKGWLNASGSHSLQALVSEVAREVRDPKTDATVLDALEKHEVEEAKSDDEKKKIAARTGIELGALGSGSDYTVFIDHLNVASLNLGYGGDGGGGVYHSIYDSFAWYTRFGDPDFTYGVALAQTAGTTIMRLADATVLPFQFTDYATTIGQYIDEIEKLRQEQSGTMVDLKPLREANARLTTSARAYEKALDGLAGVPSATLTSRKDQLAALNRLLYTSERRLGYEKGLPRRDWFTHLIYAPGFYTGYGVKTLPGVREGIEEKTWSDAEAYVPITAGAISALADQVAQAAQALTALAR